MCACEGFRRDVYRRLVAKVGHARREDLLKRIANSARGIDSDVCLKRRRGAVCDALI